MSDYAQMKEENRRLTDEIRTLKGGPAAERATKETEAYAAAKMAEAIANQPPLTQAELDARAAEADVGAPLYAGRAKRPDAYSGAGGALPDVYLNGAPTDQVARVAGDEINRPHETVAERAVRLAAAKRETAMTQEDLDKSKAEAGRPQPDAAQDETRAGRKSRVAAEDSRR